ncbi:MAG: hypothetical protein K8S97_03770 [Anaerolineae bacterium]|nr:hypothetical protein [Anaerolineae bacterium]
MKRGAVVLILIVVLLAQGVPVQAQDDDCRELMAQVNTLIGQAMTALDTGDVETAQALLGAAQTLADVCLDESGTATPDPAVWVEETYSVAHGGTITFAYPPGWVVFNPQDAGEAIEGLFLVSSAAGLEAMLADDVLPSGELVVRMNLVPLAAVEGDYTDIVEGVQLAAGRAGDVQADAITETTINGLPAAYVTVYDPDYDAQSFTMLIEGENTLVLLISMVVEGDPAYMEQMALAIAETIVLDGGE